MNLKDTELVQSLIRQYFPQPASIEFQPYSKEGFDDYYVIINDLEKGLRGSFLIKEQDVPFSIEFGLKRLKYKMDHWEDVTN